MAHVGSQVHTPLTLESWADGISLTAFNCQPIRFQAQVENGLKKDFPEGLNSSRAFHFVIVDVSIIDQDILKQMRSLQPKAQFVF